ncbi:hypothetical protein BJY01DRAFT_259495 [Aspergillus pseudoustus]|uniref:BTB domain-containing protein n=1 Tax=Aspergillus pseudoustus TaxID=1810923 RepID=A0ABR4J3L1_9EURO
MQKADARICYELDPAGDVTLVVTNVPQNLPRNLASVQSEVLAGTSQVQNSSTQSKGTQAKALRIRASTKHLTLSCSYFARRFASGMGEGVELKSQGSVELDIDHPNGLAFLVLMMIVHCRHRRVPRVLSKRTLTHVAELVDYYQCHDAVEVFSDMWIKAIEKTSEKLVSEALDWITISWVFGYPSKFYETTRRAIETSDSTITSGGRPIPAVIIDKMNKERCSFIKGVIDDLHKLNFELIKGCLNGAPTTLDNNELCTYTVLGAFTKSLMELELLTPKPDAPYAGIQIWKLLQDCKSMNSPAVTDPSSSFAHDKCRLSTRVTAMLAAHKSPQGFDLDAQPFRELREW